MASQTLAPDLSSTASVEVENEVQSDVKKVEAENVSPPKESLENSKPDESPCPAASSMDSEATIKEDKIEATVTEDVKDVIAGEKPKAEESAVAPAPLVESAGHMIEDEPVVEANKDIETVAKEAVPEPNTASVSEPTAEIAECKSDEKSETKPTEKQGDDLKFEPIEGKPEGPEKVIDVLGSSPADVVMEKTEELPANAGVTAEAKDDTVAEDDCKPEENSAPDPVVAEKSLVAEEIGKELLESQPVVEVKAATEKVEDDILANENKTRSIESLDHVKSDTPVTQVEEKYKDRCLTDEVLKETGEGNEEKKPGKETVVEPGKSEADGEALEAKSEGKSSIGQKIKHEPIEPPSTEEEKKTEDALIVEACDKDIHEGEKETVPEPNTISIQEPITEKADCKSEEKPETASATKNQVEELKLDSVESKPEECVHESPQANIVKEKVERVAAKVVEATDAKEDTVSEVVCSAEETSEATPTVQEKPQEKSEVDVTKVEDTSSTKEDETISVHAKPDTTVVEERGPAETVVILEKNGAGTEAKDAKIEEKSHVAEELTKAEEKLIVDDKTTAIPLSELLEKAAKEDVTSRNTEMVVENGGNENEISAPAETTNDADVMEKAVKEAQESEAAEKIESVVQVTEAKLEGKKEVCEEVEKPLQSTNAKLDEEKQVNEPAKTDVHQPKCIEDTEDTKTTQDIPKEDAPVKTQKQSIVKMVKQSLSKAKKAIIGKSHHSKTPASEPKDDGNE